MTKTSHRLAAIAASSLFLGMAAHAEDKGFLITGGATYLTPNTNSLDYVSVVSASPTDDIVRAHDFNPSYNWGYFLAAGYTISKDYDVLATWAQFDSNDEDNTSATGAVGGVSSYLTSNNINIPLAVGDSVRAHSHETINTQILDLTIGQTHVLTQSMDARIFAGVRYANIDSTVTNLYESAVFAETPYEKYKSSYIGVGPEAGMDLQFKVYDAPFDPVSIVGSLGVAFLIGEQESKTNIFVSGTENISAESNARIIPNLNAKLGLRWGLLEAGYQANYFYQVVDQIQDSSLSNSIKHNYSDIGITGVYFNMSAKI